MCNLSQGIKEEGIAIGRAEGEAGLIIKMVLRRSRYHSLQIRISKR